MSCSMRYHAHHTLQVSNIINGKDSRWCAGCAPLAIIGWLKAKTQKGQGEKSVLGVVQMGWLELFFSYCCRKECQPSFRPSIMPSVLVPSPTPAPASAPERNFSRSSEMPALDGGALELFPQCTHGCFTAERAELSERETLRLCC